MSLGTSNRDGGKTSESGHLRGVSKGVKGQVENGLAVSQRGAGANMSVDVAIGDAFIPRSDGTYAHPAFNDAVYNQVIATADVSNPRRDIIVMYIDYANAVSTGVSNNTNGVVKIKSVAGTPAGSPSDPSGAAIQASVGSGNPYTILARVRVAAGASSITNSVIDDLRIMATGLLQGGWIYEDLYTWAYASASTFTVAGVDLTSVYPVGTKLALYQSGSIKYFTVTAIAFSTNTTVTVDGGGTYTLANVPIDRPAYTYVNGPSGFPRSTIVDPYDGYTLLGRGILGSNAATLAVTFAARKYLRILIFAKTVDTASITGMVNGDAGSNYADTYSLWDGNANGTDINTAIIPIYGLTLAASNSVTAIIDVVNELASHKSFIGRAVRFTGTAANAPIAEDVWTKWVNTAAQITSFTLKKGSGSLGTGTEVIVLGRD